MAAFGCVPSKSLDELAERARLGLPLFGSRPPQPPPRRNPQPRQLSRYSQPRCRYFVWRNTLRDQYRCYGTQNWTEPDPDDERCVWRGDDYAAGCFVALRHNGRAVRFGGREQSVQAWSRETGINLYTLRYRLSAGWPPRRALKEPPARQRA